jgi:hypothetical protein
MKKKREFSKVIFIFVSVATFLVTVFSCVMIWRTNDLSPLVYLIPAVFTELATATGFYYYKAKRENEIKLRLIYGKKAGEFENEDYTGQIS